jgi:glycerol-3-phosphate responsive antiterminator
VSTVSSDAVVVDLEVDFHNEDETGYIWTWLSEARDPSMIAPERIVVVGDDDAIAMARVVDLVEHENGTIVHVEILPGTVAEYFEAVARAAVIPA